MANENEYANMSHVTEIIAATFSPAFVESDQVLPYVALQVLDGSTMTAKFNKLGKVEAQIVAEGSNYTVDADSEITDSLVTCTAEKSVQAQKVTVEALDFPGRWGGWQRRGADAGKAHARLLASKLKGMFSGATANSVTATSTLTKDNLLDARYLVVAGVGKESVSPKLVGMFDYKGMNEIAKELTSITAGWAFQADLGVLGISTGAKPKGELFDIALIETSGLSTSGADDIGCVWDPAWAFCCVVSANSVENPGTEIRFTGSQGLHYELTTWTYFKIAEFNDAALCKVLSDT